MQREPMFPLHTHFLERLGYPRGKPLLEKIGYPPSCSPFPKTSDFWGIWLSEGETAFKKKSVIPLGLPLPENLRFFGGIWLSEGETAFKKKSVVPLGLPFPENLCFY